MSPCVHVGVTAVQVLDGSHRALTPQCDLTVEDPT